MSDKHSCQLWWKEFNCSSCRHDNMGGVFCFPARVFLFWVFVANVSVQCFLKIVRKNEQIRKKISPADLKKTSNVMFSFNQIFFLPQKVNFCGIKMIHTVTEMTSLQFPPKKYFYFLMFTNERAAPKTQCPHDHTQCREIQLYSDFYSIRVIFLGMCWLISGRTLSWGLLLYLSLVLYTNI